MGTPQKEVGTPQEWSGNPKNNQGDPKREQGHPKNDGGHPRESFWGAPKCPWSGDTPKMIWGNWKRNRDSPKMIGDTPKTAGDTPEMTGAPQKLPRTSQKRAGTPQKSPGNPSGHPQKASVPIPHPNPLFWGLQNFWILSQIILGDLRASPNSIFGVFGGGFASPH